MPHGQFRTRRWFLSSVVGGMAGGRLASAQVRGNDSRSRPKSNILRGPIVACWARSPIHSLNSDRLAHHLRGMLSMSYPGDFVDAGDLYQAYASAEGCLQTLLQSAWRPLANSPTTRVLTGKSPEDPAERS